MKGFLAVLLVGSGLMLWYVSGFFSAAGNRSAALQNALPTPAPDTDGDGLNDYEEPYWGTDFKNPDSDGDGFQDGEEILSGHDPAKRGPNDSLNGGGNVTQQASVLLLGSLATGTLNPDSPTYQQAIDAIVDNIFAQYQDNITFEGDSIASTPNTTDAVITYGLKMTRILPVMLQEISVSYTTVVGIIQDVPLDDLAKLHTINPEQSARFIRALDTEISNLETKVKNLKAIPVPTSLITLHQNLLAYLRGVQQQYRALRTIRQDPLQGLIAFQVLAVLTSDTAVQLSADFSVQLSNAFQNQ